MNTEPPNMTTPPPIGINPIFWIGMSQDDKRRYSIVKLMSGILSGQHEGDEFTIARTINERRNIGNNSNSFPIPYDILCDTERGMFRDRSVIMSSGAIALFGLVKGVEIHPKLVYKWGIANITTDLKTKRLYERKRITCNFHKYEWEDLQVPEMEPIIYSDLADGLALLVDSAAIAGAGTEEEPTGILNTDGITEVPWAAEDGITQETIAKFPEALAKNNALLNAPVFILTPALYQSMMVTHKDTRNGTLLIGDNGMLGGYRAFQNVNNLGDNIVFGDFSQLILGFWGALELSRYEVRGRGVIYARIDMDVCVRNAASFCKGIQT